MLHGAAQIRFDGNAVLLFELPQFPRIAIVHDDWLVVFRKPQSGHERAGDASAAKKDGRLQVRSFSRQIRAGRVGRFDERRHIRFGVGRGDDPVQAV